MPTKDGKRIKEKVVEGADKVEDEDWGQEEWEVVRCSRFYVTRLFLIPVPLGHVDRSRAV